MKLNTHALKMKGLRKISGESKVLKGGAYSTHCFEIFYDMSSGEAYYEEHIGNGCCVCNNADVITCGRIYSPCTMQELADLIYREVDYVETHRF